MSGSSAVSRQLVALTKQKLDVMVEASVGDLDLAVLVVDGIHIDEHVVLVALGIDVDGRRHERSCGRARVDQLTWTSYLLPMTTVNIAQAKARLSQLIDAALRGEEVVIARRNEPLVRLTVVGAAKARAVFGSLKGRIWMSDDFDEPLEDFAEYT